MLEGHLDKCYFCHNGWGHCTCGFKDGSDGQGNPTDAPGFSFNEFFITKPNVSVCTRYFVDPNVYYGAAYQNYALGDAWTNWPVDPVLSEVKDHGGSR